jgi:hypothetical protein
MFTGRLSKLAGHSSSDSEPVEKQCTFETLIANSAGFEKKIIKFPTKANRIAVIAGKDTEKRHVILNHAKTSRVVGVSLWMLLR